MCVKKMPRISYNKKLTSRICESVAEGKSVRELCKAKGMPTPKTVWAWLAKYPEFSEQYARAKETAMEAMAEEIMAIADDGANDYMDREDPDNPGYAINGEHIQRSKLRVDTRRWLMSKLAPKKYGEKLKLNVEGTMTLADRMARSKERVGDDD